MDYLSLIQSIPPHRVALIEDGHTYTYGEITEQASQIRSLSPVSAPPTVLWIREGSVHGQLVHFLALSGTSRIPVIVPGDMKHLLQRPRSKEIPSDACMGVLTSGTTGFPKLWYRTLESWSAFFPVQNSIFGVTMNTRLFAQGSLAFTGNLNLYLCLLSIGALIITASPVNPVVWQKEIETHFADTIYLIPSKLRLLAKKVSVPLPQAKTILTGSQSLGLKDIEIIKKAFPCSRCYLYYGASELSYVTWLTDEEMNSNPACIGKPFPGLNVTLCDNEIYVDTPYSAIGITGHYSVGDTGYMDDQGYLYFNGRKDNVYNIHGRKISAVKIENALTSLDEIQEAAVVCQSGSIRAHIVLAGAAPISALAAPVPIASPSQASDTAISASADDSPAISTSFAYVAPHDPQNNCLSLCKNIKEELKAYLELWEIPRDIIIHKELPKNNSGKTVRKLLSAKH